MLARAAPLIFCFDRLQGCHSMSSTEASASSGPTPETSSAKSCSVARLAGRNWSSLPTRSISACSRSACPGTVRVTVRNAGQPANVKVVGRHFGGGQPGAFFVHEEQALPADVGSTTVSFDVGFQPAAGGEFATELASPRTTTSEASSWFPSTEGPASCRPAIWSWRLRLYALAWASTVATALRRQSGTLAMTNA